MNVTIISTEFNDELESTKYFALLLSKTLTLIRMSHWYILNHNIHEILGNLYEDLDQLFDKLQEEIIGTSRSSGVPFPSFSPETLNIDNLEQYESDNAGLLDSYYKTVLKLSAILGSTEFSNYINSIDSGINNTKEDILSRINKTNYLLSMVKE